MARNPMISLQAVLIPRENTDFYYRAQAITAFQRGKTFTHLLHGRETPCSIWDYAEGDMVKIRYDEHTKVAFYRITRSDLIKMGGKIRSVGR